MKILCTICARGGSKGVPGKNLKQLSGRPLIVHSIEQAKATGLFASIAVSSDDDTILAVARDHGAHIIKRPDELASDNSGKLPAIRHCVQSFEKLSKQNFDIIVDLDATSPLRIPEDITNCINLLIETNASNVITTTPARKSPYFNMVETDDSGRPFLSKKPDIPVVRRQDSPKCYEMNASIYVWRREYLMQSHTLFQDRTKMYIMPEERSFDIDTPFDFRFVEYLVNHQPATNGKGN